jgi:hypothetical protein
VRGGIEVDMTVGAPVLAPTNLPPLHPIGPTTPTAPADSIDSLLKIHDPILYQHFEALGVPTGPLGWTLISSMFSEVLG